MIINGLNYPSNICKKKQTKLSIKKKLTKLLFFLKLIFLVSFFLKDNLVRFLMNIIGII